MDSFVKNVKDSKYLNKKQSNFVNINIVIVQGNYVDKASFLLRLKYKDYNKYNEHLSEIDKNFGLDLHLIKLILNYRDININIIIRDTTWINRDYFFNYLSLFKKADFIFFFYESFSQYYLDSIKTKLDLFNKFCNRNLIFVLIRCRYDIGGKIEISDEEALEFADKNNMLFFHLSLNEKNETGVKELFETVINEYFRRKKTEINEDDKF